MKGHTTKHYVKSFYSEDGERDATVYTSGGMIHTVVCEDWSQNGKAGYKSFTTNDAKSRAFQFAEKFVTGNASLPAS